jgi:CII-binding regulator of phage lambda lysogenization HflD
VQILQAIDKQTRHLDTFSRGFQQLSDNITSGNIQDQKSDEYHVEVQEIGPKLREIRNQSSTIQETVHETSQQLSAVASQSSSVLSSMARLLSIITSGMLSLQSLRRKVVELIHSWSTFTAEMRDFTKQTLSVDFQGTLHLLMKNLQTNFWANTRGSQGHGRKIAT